MKKIKLFFTALTVILATSLASAQNLQITGVISDSESGEAVAGASVVVKGQLGSYAITDADGAYKITAPANGTLEVACLGYHTQEVQVSGRAVINVVLVTDARMLEETIVIAYGTSTKSSFTGSAAVVDSEEIAKTVASSVTSSLRGSAPGVQVISSTGDPTDSSPTIRIRGFGSMSASNAPLIILDGVPYDSSISNINPSDVESMTVLKDASAAAIYGARGANGVIIITTKKGQSGDAKITVDAKFGSNSRGIPQYDVISDPGEYYETAYRMLYGSYYYSGHSVAESYAFADAALYDNNNGGVGYQVYTVPAGEKLIGTNFKLNPNATLGYTDGEYYYTPDNWYDEVFHSSFRQEYNASVSGSGDKYNIYASLGYLNDGGIINNSGYERFSGRVNVDYQAKKWLKLNASMAYTHSASQTNDSNGSWGSSGNIFYIVNNIAPIYPLYVRNADGTIMTENGRTVYDYNQTNFTRASFTGNAVRDNEYDSTKSLGDNMIAKGGITITPIAGLSLMANVAANYSSTRYNYLYSVYGSGNSTDGIAYVYQSRFLSLNQQYLAEYKRSFGLHNLDVLAGYEQYKYTSSYLYGQNDHLFNPTVGELNNADGTSSKYTGSSTSYYMTEGFLARAQYDYAGKYFASASYRRDSSSRFAEGHRWGNFGSIGGAWLMSQEDFMAGAKDYVDMLKLKVSYGVQGNDNLGSLYPYADQYTHSYDETNGVYSLSLSYKGNEDLTWETSKSFNVGADFELFKNYLNGSFEFYNRKTEDLLYYKDVPQSSGNPTGEMPVNVGSIRNLGFELTLDGKILDKKNFQWTWNANFSHYKNTILELDESVSENGIIGSYYIYEVGGSLYDAYMYKYAGVDPETGEALYWQHIDADEENGIEESDVTTTVFSDATRYKLGSVLPKLYGGFGTSLSFYGVDISAQLSYQLGGKYYDGSYQQLMWTQRNSGMAMHKDLLKAWTPENTDTDVPRLDGDTQVAQSAVDRFLTSSNYLNIDNVTIGYTFPSKLVKPMGLSALRIYVAGENLYVFTARKGMDPRDAVGLQMYTSSNRGTSTYSALRTITGGITLTF